MIGVEENREIIKILKIIHLGDDCVLLIGDDGTLSTISAFSREANPKDIGPELLPTIFSLLLLSLLISAFSLASCCPERRILVRSM